jgi:ribosomal protein S18 acetylase RimI-like enzyme
VRSLKAIQRKAVLSGTAFVWAVRALTGRYDLRLGAMWRIVRNKALFITSGQKYRSQGDAQLLNVAVHPDARGRGIATALVEEGLRAMGAAGVSEVRLEVRPSNASARRVYERTGWREVGRTRDIEGEWMVMVAKPPLSKGHNNGL